MTAPESVSVLGVDLPKQCFVYPQQPPGRKHGPRGYREYEAHRDWLRDEFLFRCAYCLMRETWLRGKAGFQIDHCVPKASRPDRAREYDNLVYTCPWCNQAKAGVAVPNPTEMAYGAHMVVIDDGRIEAKSDLGAALVTGLRLDHPELTAQRRLVQQTVRLAEEKGSVSAILRLLGYPVDLPNLKRKRPPGGNARPDGVHDCCYEKRRRGRLSAVY